MSDTPVDAPEEAPAAPEPDLLREPIIEHLRADLGDAVLDTVVARGDMWMRVRNESWVEAAGVLKSHGFEYFCFLSGIDWLNNADFATRYEQTYAPSDDTAEAAGAGEEEAGSAGGTYLLARTGGGTTRFQVFARLYDVDRKVGITVKTDLDDTNPSVETWTSHFRGADWHERETHEMYGFEFRGHTSMRNLYLPTGFEGYPLRKDFPLLARAVKPWPGLVDKEPVPGEGDEEEEG